MPAINTLPKYFLSLAEIKHLQVDWVYYPMSDLHLTILSVISCVAGFKLSDIQLPAYIDAFQEALSKMKCFDIDFRGITTAPAGILLKGYPCDDSLQQLRNYLRTAFHQANIPTTIDARYKLVAAHSTLVRCQAPLRDSSEMVNFLSQYQHHNFGRITITDINLVFNNWYQQVKTTQKLAKISLSI